jgi:integrase
VLADVERGLWAPDVARAAEAPASPTFHEFASDWLHARRPELRESTLADYSWQLSNHLLPFFHRHRLPQITVAEVDRYRDFKVRERVLSPESINKTITRLGQILAVAEERDLIARNPVRVNTRNRKLKTKRKRPVFLESAEQIAAMIDAATERRGHQPLPAGVTAHKLRHTFASILYVRGEDPPYVMAQLGHTDPGFTLRVYAHAMRRDEGDKERLKALVEGRDWAPMGTERPDERADAPIEPEPENDETPADAGASEDGRGGFRTCDLSRVKRALSH